MRLKDVLLLRGFRRGGHARTDPVNYFALGMMAATYAGLSLIIIATVFASRQPADGGAELFRLVWARDPAHVATIGWNQKSGSSPVAYYGPEDHGRHWERYPHSVAPHRLEWYKGMANTFARLKGLRPDTAYYFVIKDSKGASPRLWFKTAPDTAKPFTFISGSDARSWPEHPPTLRANKMAAKLRPLFIMFNGDFTTNGLRYFFNNADEWRWWFKQWQLTITPDGRIPAIAPGYGNHEKSTEPLYRLFDLPRPENYYAFSIGGDYLRVYVLNYDLALAPAQQAWLERDLAEHKHVRFKIATFHKAFFPHYAGHRENLDLYENWAELFYEHGVSLVCNGHSHLHAVSYPVRPEASQAGHHGFVPDFERGMMFVGEGGWGSRAREFNDPKPWTLSAASLFQFKWIHAHPDRFEIHTVNTDNVGQVGRLSEDSLFDKPAGLRLATTPGLGEAITYPMRPRSLAGIRQSGHYNNFTRR